TDQSIQVSPRLVVWPSGLVDAPRGADDPAWAAIGASARELDTTLVAPARAAPGVPETAYVFGRDGQLLGQRPRSEVVPLAGGGPFLRSGTVLTNPARLGLMLGWEMEVPALACYQVRDDAELLVASASGRRDIGRAGRAQRAAAGRMRAVETRRFVVQVNGFGLSQIVDPYGREQLRTGVGAIWAVGYAGTISGYTPYVIWGRWVGPASAALAAAVLLGAALGALWRAAGRRPDATSADAGPPANGGEADG
ncbi:MAG TPA: nitrilase-related carbon-nitrogen hydrolase, partial [Armatimonadota bacterium]|nr:nitrilase-related carbon-nitrogen hydrolase [Armatimonadota bacterium]